jgi:translation initiation factor 4G
MLYDLEIIEEEVFIKWKEDINDEFPGKGKALFQVCLIEVLIKL